MADEVGGRVGNDGAAHEHAATYDRFTSAMKWGTVTVAVLLILLALFLVR
jgi:hypothetical protein